MEIDSSSVDLSVIIVNYNSHLLLKNCINSIQKNTCNINFEIIVIDNASSEKIDIKFSKNVRLIQNKNNKGFSFAVNQGIKESKGRYILALNPDTIILENALEKMISFLDNHETCGIVGPKVYDRDNKLQFSRRSFPTHLTFFFNYNSLLTRRFPQNRWSKKYLLANLNNFCTCEVDWVSGCCIMIRKQLLEEIGLFDTRFFMYNEDVDICRRTKNNGWRIFYYPDAEIVHFMGGSSSREEMKLVFERHRSIWIYYKKYLSRNKIIDSMAYLAILTRAIFHSLLALVK